MDDNHNYVHHIVGGPLQIDALCGQAAAADTDPTNRHHMTWSNGRICDLNFIRHCTHIDATDRLYAGKHNILFS